MNYRHEFHAGNFCDVLKHAVLSRVITYYKRKSAPFRVIDTHAGSGHYDLTCEAAQKTLEWRNGVGRLLNADLTDGAAELLAPYIDSIRALNRDEKLRLYPGSPALSAILLRNDDRLIANELRPQDYEALKANLRRDRRVKILNQDGWSVLKSVLPPKERRAITLVDPPFEQPGEFDRLLQACEDHHRRFETGTLILWYPIKDRSGVGRLERALRASNRFNGLMCTLSVAEVELSGPVTSCGVVVINPPYVLRDELIIILPQLCSLLQRSDAASTSIEAL